eukprot:3126821-Rhodomonas_salina.1
MWSFRLKQAVLLEGPRFFSMYPFLTPEGVVNRDHFTAADAKQMHAEDGDMDDLFGDEEEEEQVSEQEDEAPSGVLKLKRPDTRAGAHKRVDQRERSSAPGEPHIKPSGEQLGKAAGELAEEPSAVPPRAEGEKIGGSA